MENPFHRVMARRRGELGISQAQAAARAGVSRSTWNAWEHAKEMMPHLTKWQLIAKVLEMPIDELEKAVSTNWFLQCGPSQFQQDLLKALGIQLGGVLPNHAFADPHLHKLDRELDVDLERIPVPILARQLGNMRNQIRNSLISQDAAIQETSELVKSFRSLYDTVAPRHYVPMVQKKTLKVPKKPPRTEPRPLKSD